MKLWSSLNVRYPTAVTMTCSWSLNGEQFILGSAKICAQSTGPERTGPERTKMLVSDPVPRGIPKIVGPNITSGVMGLNNKAKVTMRKGYGSRTFRITELSLFHVLGTLPEPNPLTIFTDQPRIEISCGP